MHYGTDMKDWWTKGIPLKIRQYCTNRWEASNREGEEEQKLLLINYIEICHNNWELFKDVISLGASDKSNKKEMTKWIRALNEIRNQVAHPTRGVLTTKQVSDVNELHSKVMEHFPRNVATS